MKTLLILLALLPQLASADPVQQVAEAAHAHFADLPQVQMVAAIPGQCGADEHVNSAAVYCTSDNTIYLAGRDAAAPYRVAHLMGHAIQVRHGIADVALRRIRANRDSEPQLRRDVTRMVECLAGVIIARADLPTPDLAQLFESEPFSGSHWGRAPLTIGPQVSIGLNERALWLAKGAAAGTPAGCDTASFPADLAVQAFRP